MIRPYFSLIIVVFVLALSVSFYSHNKLTIDTFFSNVFADTNERIDSVSAFEGYFFVEGNDLSTVELWIIPTGTNIDEEDNMKLGNATVSSESGELEIWVFPIPKDPLLVAEIYAKGLDEKGKEVGRVFLPISGATNIYNALWASERGNPGEMVLSPGEKGKFDELEITFLKILQDSRCPIDVKCIQAGGLEVSMRVKTATSSKDITLSSANSQGENVYGYNVSMGEIEPEKTTSITPQNTKYLVTFVLSKF